MATASEDRDYQARRRMRKCGNTSAIHPVGGVSQQLKREILHEAEKLVIKPGTKLVWDDETNRMVWR